MEEYRHHLSGFRRRIEAKSLTIASSLGVAATEISAALSESDLLPEGVQQVVDAIRASD